MERFYSYNTYLKNRFGSKVYKLSLDSGRTCPNRDGTCGIGGCIFCSGDGSGEFAEKPKASIKEQLQKAKERVNNKIGEDGKYIAYFQSFTNTYAPISILKEQFETTIVQSDIVSLAIATRPDCLPDDVLDLLESLNLKKPITVELGLQTIHEDSAKYIRRGYELPIFEKAVSNLKARGIRVTVHVIFGLPTETKERMLETIEYLAKLGIDGIKIQVLQVLKGTDLEKEYLQRPFQILSKDEYIELVANAIERLPKNVVIERITGDPPKKILIEPKWTANKRDVLNSFTQYFNENEIFQASKWRE